MSVEDIAKVKIKIILPSGAVVPVEREVTVAKAIKVLDYLTKEDVELPAESSLPETRVAVTAPVRPPSELPSEFKIPSRSVIETFIRSRPSFEHTVEDVVIEFTGREITSADGKNAKRFFNAIRTKLMRIRRDIQKKDGGHWEEDREGHYKKFRFVKQAESNTGLGSLFAHKENELQE